MSQQKHISKKVVTAINLVSLSALVLLIPISQSYLSPIIGLWLLTSLILIVVKPLKFRFNKSLISLMTLYVLLVLGLLWTQNRSAGQFDLEVKMSLFIFPFFFSFLEYQKSSIKVIIYSFLSGLLLSALFLLYFAYLNFSINYQIDHFFYVNLSTILHPSYLSFYVIVGLLVLLNDLKNGKFQLFKNKLIYVLLIVFLFLFNVLLLSKIGLVVSFIVVFWFIGQWIYIQKKYVKGLGLLMLMFCCFYLAYQQSPYVKQRVKEFVSGLSSSSDQPQHGSTAIRLEIWSQGLELIKHKPLFGYGTGDVKDELMRQYKTNGVEEAFAKKLNAHNQFIQMTIAVGLLGFAIFTLAFYFGFTESLASKNHYYFGFLLISLFFMLPESMLENQAGTIAFGLFFSLFNQKIFSHS
ncbi:MAG: O-antigen ligase family protein [Putridiphycobacter sp.]